MLPDRGSIDQNPSTGDPAMTAHRLAQLTATRNRLNALGDDFYWHAHSEWDCKRIHLRNRINARLRR